MLFWNINRAASQNPRGKFRVRIGMQGGSPDADTKENPALETVRGRSFRGDDAKKGVDVLAEGGREVISQKRRDSVSDIWEKIRSKWTPTCNGVFKNGI